MCVAISISRVSHACVKTTSPPHRWQHLEQRSFKMTEAQYMDKVDSVAYMVNVLGQTARVREFLSSRARSERGLPRRPVVGTAVSGVFVCTVCANGNV